MFWHLTPKEWKILFVAAKDRREHHHSRRVTGAWVANHADIKGLEGYLAGEPEPLEGAALDRQLTSISADLPVIDLATYLQSKGAS